MNIKSSIQNIALLSVLTIFFTACSFSPQVKAPTSEPNNPPKNTETPADVSLLEELQNQSQVQKFETYSDLVAFMESHPLEQNDSFTKRGMEPVMMESMETSNPSLSSSQLESGDTSNDYSQTNIQVEGVDEADIIKSDGEHLYILSENNIFIVKASPSEESEVISQIAFKSYPQNMFVNGDKLVVFGYDEQIYQTETYTRFQRGGSFMFFKVFDISDRKNPKQVKDLNFEGNYANSRMIGDYVYMVTSDYRYDVNEDEPILSRVIDSGNDIEIGCEDDRCFSPDIYYFDLPYSSYNFTNIYAINVQDLSEQISGEVYLLSGTQNLYTSQKNMYITYTKYINEYYLEKETIKELIMPVLPTDIKEKIKTIKATESFILTKNEKDNKIAMMIERYIQTLPKETQSSFEKDFEIKMKEKYQNISKELEKTVIHKISLNENKIEYKTFGEVTGHVLNQFSMNESNGYFQIATTKNQTWSRYIDEEQKLSYSNLYILDEDMKQVGAVEELAKDERIYSVRFMQDRAYMVTFKQTDPLFVIDTKDPKNPSVLGELKIPGFSNYLHPYDENHLIGIGRDADENGRAKGLKLSLFNVSDVANPTEVDNYIFEDSTSSNALYDHKAVLFSKEKNLLALPLSDWEQSFFDGSSGITGAAIFDIDEKGFKLQGKIYHSDILENPIDSKRKPFPIDDEFPIPVEPPIFLEAPEFLEDIIDPVRKPINEPWKRNIKRILYIGDELYTVSDAIVQIHAIKDLEEQKTLLLEVESNDFEVIN